MYKLDGFGRAAATSEENLMRSHHASKAARVAISAALLISQIATFGCGKAPLSPREKSSTSARQLRDPADRASEEMPSGDDPPVAGGGSSYTAPPNWYGGKGSLP